jgi:hypothetical protein
MAVAGRSIRPAICSGVAHPVWLATAARIAARSWLAASTSAGSVRLAGVVSSAQRRAERLQASWAFSSAGLSLSTTPASISARSRFADDDGGGGDERLHAGHPDQIGRVWVVGEGPVGLDLPGGQCGVEAHGWSSPTGCRLVDCVDPPRRQGTGGELLDRVESGNHAPCRLDLQRGRSLNQGLASPHTHFQAMLQVTLIPNQRHRGGVSRDMQGVQ